MDDNAGLGGSASLAGAARWYRCGPWEWRRDGVASDGTGNLRILQLPLALDPEGEGGVWTAVALNVSDKRRFASPPGAGFFVISPGDPHSLSCVQVTR